MIGHETEPMLIFKGEWITELKPKESTRRTATFLFCLVRRRDTVARDEPLATPTQGPFRIRDPQHEESYHVPLHDFLKEQ